MKFAMYPLSVAIAVAAVAPLKKAVVVPFTITDRDGKPVGRLDILVICDGPGAADRTVGYVVQSNRSGFHVPNHALWSCYDEERLAESLTGFHKRHQVDAMPLSMVPGTPMVYSVKEVRVRDEVLRVIDIEFE